MMKEVNETEMRKNKEKKFWQIFGQRQNAINVSVNKTKIEQNCSTFKSIFVRMDSR